jgi:hypothetical protein
VNAVVLSAIYELAAVREDASAGPVAGDIHLGIEDHAEAREALKPSVRGWSKGGRGQRQTVGLVLDGSEKLEKGCCKDEGGLGSWSRSGRLGRFYNSVRSPIACLPLDSRALIYLARI